jgi:hypothetical protein
MTKDEALKMAIAWMDKWHDKEVIVINVGQRWVDFSMPITACKEALEQPAQRNFCERCGKRASKDPYHIHTCTPPQALKEKNHVS